MTSILSLSLLVAFLAAGFVVARLARLGESRLVGRAFDGILRALLLSMGLRMGQDREIVSSLGSIGLLSSLVALVTVAGTVAAHLSFAPVYRALSGDGVFRGPSAATPSSRGPGGKLLSLAVRLRHPFFLLGFVAAGAALGRILPVVGVVADGTLSGWILYAMLFVIGIQMAPSGARAFRSFASPLVVLVPFVTVLGTLAGALSLVVLKDPSPGTALARGAGVGGYSLSGVLIAELGTPALGAAAFLSNLLRETLAFFLIPLLAFAGRPEAGIGVGGATSMDVTLPLIEDAWGPAVVPLCLAHGFVLSLAVPFLVPLFMGL